MADVRDRIIAHRDAPEIYDAPSYQKLVGRILQLERSLTDIRAIAVDGGDEIYALMSNRALEEN
jgi:hypothetical protein